MINLKKSFKYIAIFALLILSFFVLMLLVSLIPSSVIKDNIISSADELYKASAIKRIFLYYQDYWTDKLMLNTAYSIDCKNPIFSLLALRINFNPDSNEATLFNYSGELSSIINHYTSLNDTINGDVSEAVAYTRYWQGYLVLLRIELIFFDYIELMIFHTFIISTLVFYTSYLVYKKFDKEITIAYFVSFLLSGITIGTCLQYYYVYLVLLLGILYLLKKDFKVDKIMYFLIIGSITNFIDFLTAPLITLLYPIILIELNETKSESEINANERIKNIVILIIVWGGSYILTWMLKWILWALSYGGIESIKAVMIQIMFRGTNGDLTIAEIISGLLELSMPFVFITIAFLFVYVYMVFFKHCKISINKNYSKYMYLLYLSIVPIIYTIALKNQVFLHARFTFRNYIPIMFILIMFYYKNISFVERKS